MRIKYWKYKTIDNIMIRIKYYNVYWYIKMKTHGIKYLELN